MTEQGLRLATIPKRTSSYEENIWQPGQEFEATCSAAHKTHLDGMPIPSPKHSCGIQLFKKPSKRNWRMGEVWGKVALWGNVVAEKSGWRCQYAYPLSIEWFICAGCYHRVRHPIKKLEDVYVYDPSGDYMISIGCPRSSRSGKKLLEMGRDQHQIYVPAKEILSPLADAYQLTVNSSLE